MKSNIFKSMAVAAFAILAGYNVYLAQPKTNDEMSDVLVANVEALSQIELPEVVINCSKRCDDGIGQCWIHDDQNSTDTHKYCRWDGGTNKFCVCS